MSVDKKKRKTSSVRTGDSSTQKKASGSKKGNSSKTKSTSGARKGSISSDGTPKSATILAIERQKRLEKTGPIGQLTADLPVIRGPLDGPDRRPWRRIKLPKFGFNREYNPLRHARLWLALCIVAIVLLAGVIIISNYTVSTVTIEGNVHYSNDEIYNMVIGDSKLSHNSIYLSLKYKNKEITDIPFIQTMDVKIVDSKTIKITVYEKAMAGFVEYLGRYFYFDKDGTVIESSNVMTTGVPQVMGLDFDHIVLYEKLPVENESVFGQILDITQLLDKYEIEMDKIYFDSNYKMTLYFDDARIQIGTFDNIDEKIIKLKSILPELSGKAGVLRLDTYTGNGGIVTFELD